MVTASAATAKDRGERAPVASFEAGISRAEIPNEEDTARARFYALLSRLLAAPPSDDTLALLARLDGDGSEMGRALGELAKRARETALEAAREEFTALFYGMGAGGELQPYASYYSTGLVYDKPLANLRADLGRLGVGAREDATEPEDHIAFVCEAMHGLVTGAFGVPAGLAAQRDFFRAHVEPWAPRFFADLEGAKAAALYAAVGTVGRLFMAIESEGFAAGD